MFQSRPKTRKALISPGYGAGWSTWADASLREDMLFDPILINAIERNGSLSKDDLAAFQTRMDYKHGERAAYIYKGGARDLEVREITGSFRVEEYDGSEYVIGRDEDEGWV